MTAPPEKYGLNKLSDEEKNLLILDLKESMADDDRESPEVLAMLRSRIARIHAELAQGIDRSVPWEDVRKEIDDWLDAQRNRSDSTTPRKSRSRRDAGTASTVMSKPSLAVS
jgi:hypothetical protein